jgi:hypothetical protein
MIPVLRLHSHDREKAIGWCKADERGLVITFNAGHYMTEKQAFAVFGYCGFEVLKFEMPPVGEPRLIEIRILQWSAPWSQ